MDEIEDEYKRGIALDKELVEAAKEMQNLAAGTDKYLKGYVPIEFKVDGFIKTYKEIVKDSDGLTVMSPSVVKALDTASVRPTAAALGAAAKAVEGQSNDLTKKNGAAAKKDVALKKRLDTFNKEMAALAAAIEKHDTVA